MSSKDKRRFKINLNIGTVVFIALFIYVIITLLLFVFKEHYEIYQVVSGPLSGNNVYNALILRDESVIKSDSDGYVNYYIGNSSKVSTSELICSVTDEEQPTTNAELDESSQARLRTLAYNASRQYDNVNFSNVYELDYSISNVLWENAAIDSASGAFYNASEDGIVSTLSDGYESITEDDLTADLGRNEPYNAQRLSSHDTVKTGDTLFRLVSGEEWSIYFPLSEEQQTSLSSFTNIDVKFLSDNNTENGELSFFTIGDQSFGKVTFDNGLIRYVDERFIDAELMSNTDTGLKIPLTSVVSKGFYIIPETFLTYSGDNGEDAGFLREVRLDDGTKTTEFVEASIYEKIEPDEDDADSEVLYYVDKSAFNDGDILVATDSDSKFTVGQVGALQGVYCVNKGYAVFRRVVIIDKNSEYCIVEQGTDYGLSLYDYIVEDGSSVKENQVVQ